MSPEALGSVGKETISDVPIGEAHPLFSVRAKLYGLGGSPIGAELAKRLGWEIAPADLPGNDLEAVA